MNPDTESEAHMMGPEGESSDGLHEWSTPKYNGQPPRHRSLHVLVLVGDALYIFGGYDGQNRVADFHKSPQPGAESLQSPCRGFAYGSFRVLL